MSLTNYTILALGKLQMSLSFSYHNYIKRYSYSCNAQKKFSTVSDHIVITKRYNYFMDRLYKTCKNLVIPMYSTGAWRNTKWGVCSSRYYCTFFYVKRNYKWWKNCFLKLNESGQTFLISYIWNWLAIKFYVVLAFFNFIYLVPSIGPEKMT